MVLAICTLVFMDWAQGWAIARMVPEVLDRRPVLTLWYTDRSLDDYLTKVSYEYEKKYNVRIYPVYKKGLKYLEAANAASVLAGDTEYSLDFAEAEEMPDLYVISNDSLEKAVLAGLAVPILDQEGNVNLGNYCSTALQAVTYQGKKVAYPFYFETTALLYNRDYLTCAAENNGSSPESMLPETIGDILKFAEAFEAPQAVEAVFKWDVSDIFYNYFFAGDEINVGGIYGDNTAYINIYNEKAVSGFKSYQTLNHFFSIDAETSSYESVIQEFLEGKLVFTVATSDVLTRIKTAQKEGIFNGSYGVGKLPDISEKIPSKSLSVTYGVAVNGYGRQQEEADAFAAWLTGGGAASLYDYTGHIPACRAYVPQVEGAAVFYEEYETSASVPKLMCTANFWLQMEAACTRIWSGADVDKTLKELAKQMESQLPQ